MTSPKRLTKQLILEKAIIKVETSSYGIIELWRLDLVRYIYFREIIKKYLAEIPVRRFAESIMQKMLIIPSEPLFPLNVRKWSDSFLLEVAMEWIRQIKTDMTDESITFDIFRQYVLETIKDDDKKMFTAFFELQPKLVDLSRRVENVRIAEDVLRSCGYGYTMAMWTPDAFAQFATTSPSEPEMTNMMLGLTRQGWFQDELLKMIRNEPFISRRLRIIEIALAAHDHRDYLVSIPLFFTQIEGILGDYLVTKGIVSKRNGKIFDEQGSELSGIIPLINCSNSIKSVNLEYVGSALKNDKLSDKRNAILHGRNYSYGRAKLSTRVLLLLWVLIYAIKNS